MRKYAYWLTLLFIFMLPWENAVIISGLGRVTRLAGLLVAAYWLGMVIVQGRIRKMSPFILLVFVYFLWTGVTLLWSANPGSTIDRITTYVQLGVLMWLFWDTITTKVRVNAAMQAYVFGAYVSVANVLENFVTGTVANSSGRFTGAGLNANGLALVLAIGMPLAWHLAINAKDTRLGEVLRVINYAYLPAAIFCVLLTASRTALFTTAPVLFFVLSTSTRMKLGPRIISTLGLVAALFLLQPLVPQTSLDRLSTTEEELTEGDLSGRTVVWERGLEVFEENTLLGTGAGTFKQVVDIKDKSAHNTYISIMVESGFVGITLFIIVILASASQVGKLNRWRRWLWLVTLVVWAIGLTTMSWEIKKISWFLLSIVVIDANTLTETAVAAQTTIPLPHQKAREAAFTTTD